MEWHKQINHQQACHERAIRWGHSLGKAAGESESGACTRGAPFRQTGVSPTSTPSLAMLMTVMAIKLIAEIALLSLVGRGVLGLLVGAQRERNGVYQLLTLVTRPLERLTRAVSPRLVLDRHIPLATGLLLLSVWVFSTAVKIQLCFKTGLQQCL